ncbi:MAG: Hpt domain-containing protein [Lachnospiraceae bacterium]|nr:Hpt domain-containing protein [Ruminococcus sp.]MCM1274674.1 Hpt domain-containing protein [Lachnospiraceae bacterium]
MGLIEDVKALGADVDDALARFMNNSALYEKMLKKLPKVIEDAPVMPYVRSGDLETAMSNAHTLKGVLGNLSLVKLYENYTETVNLLRGGDTAAAEKLLTETLELQKSFLECIEKHM